MIDLHGNFPASRTGIPPGASLVAVVTPATDKTCELVRSGLTRAYFCEQLALRHDVAHACDYFFTGLFSVMDAVLDRPAGNRGGTRLFHGSARRVAGCAGRSYMMLSMPRRTANKASGHPSRERWNDYHFPKPARRNVSKARTNQ